MALNSLFCADVPIRNYSLTRSLYVWVCRRRCERGQCVRWHVPTHDTATDSTRWCLQTSTRRRL